jgi:hypothetical protein
MEKRNRQKESKNSECVVKYSDEGELTGDTARNMITTDFYTVFLPNQVILPFESRRSSVVEQLIRNQQVGGSIPLAGSIFFHRNGGLMRAGIHSSASRLYLASSAYSFARMFSSSM